MWSPIGVSELELTQPEEHFRDLRAYRRVSVLLKWRGTPSGNIEIPVAGGRLATSDLVDRILDAHLPLIARWALADALRAGAPPSLDIFKPRGSFSSDPDASGPRVSVVVCTRERPDALNRCLTALDATTPPPFEVVVVDNAPAGDETKHVVERFGSMRYVREPRPGLDWARSRGVLEARGDVVAFTDDDVVVDRHWPGAIARTFQLYPSVGAVTGLIAAAELATRSQLDFELHGGFNRGFLPIWVHHSGGAPLPWRALATGVLGSGANMAFRRDLFERIGLFLPQLDAGTRTEGGGDLEILFRTLKFGYPVIYDPRALVWHHHRREPEDFARQIGSWGVATFAMLESVRRQFPDEARNVRRYGRFWKRRLLQRVLADYLRPPRVLADGRWQELVGAFKWKRRYEEAVERVRQIEKEFGPLAEVSTMADRSRLPAGRAWPPHRVAVRVADSADGIQPIDDVGEYEVTRVFVQTGGRPLGHVDVRNKGLDISPEQLVDRMLETRDAIDWVALAIGTSRESALAALRSRLGERLQLATSSRVSVGAPARMRASIVLATCDRPTELRRCLTSLTRVTRPHEVEILVVDNRPGSPATADVVRDFAGVIRIEESRRGLSYARNAGFVRATSDIIVCTDDDVVFADDWLDSLLAPFHRNDIDIVCGNVLPMSLETESQIRFEQYGGLGRGHEAVEVGEEWFFRNWRAVETWRLGATANAAFRTNLLRDPDVGLFEETLGPGMPAGVGEDTYFFYRALASGYRIRYEPSSIVWHEHRQTTAGLRRQLMAYSKGHIAYHLHTLVRHGDCRALVNFGRLASWRLKSVSRAIISPRQYPLNLILTEILGNLLGPAAYIRSCRLVRRQGRSDPMPAALERPETHREVRPFKRGE